VIVVGKVRSVLLAVLVAFAVSSCSAASVPSADRHPIRVSISDDNFKKFAYVEIEIFGTADYRIHLGAPNAPLMKIPRDLPTKVKFSNDSFEMSCPGYGVMKNVGGPIFVECPHGLLGVSGLRRRDRMALYRGKFEILKTGKGEFFLVNEVSLDDYLKGVVPNEMPVKFGIEALKAQAVASRNYALAPRVKEFNEFDVFDSIGSQVYFGANFEHPESDRAVRETSGIVMLHNWDLILALFSSTAGGYTENYENAFSAPRTNVFPGPVKPYLKGTPDDPSVGNLQDELAARKFYRSSPKSYDVESSYYRWKREWTSDELVRVLPRALEDEMETGFVKILTPGGKIFGKVEQINVKKRGVSGKIMEMEIVTSTQRYLVRKELTVRRVFRKNGNPLPSANVVFDLVFNRNGKLEKVVATGGGFGHGVGMSQFGAGFMGTHLHKTFDQILKRYYSDVSIATVPVTLSVEGNRAESRNFWAAKKSATLVVDSRDRISKFVARINGKSVSIRIDPVKNRSGAPLRIDISKHIRRGVNVAEFFFPKSVRGSGSLRAYIELF
jgi:SpoIID/LytB domain protein